MRQIIRIEILSVQARGVVLSKEPRQSGAKCPETREDVVDREAIEGKARIQERQEGPFICQLGQWRSIRAHGLFPGFI